MTGQQTINKNENKVLLCIFDGFGVGDKTPSNAISSARTPNLDKALKKYPHSLLRTNGRSVGLPDGQMGNSEVGHTTIGAGRIYKQKLLTINESIDNGTFGRKKEIINLIKNKNSKAVHLIGMFSSGGVHSSIKHLHALIEALGDKKKIFLHLFSDGRDVPPDYFQKQIKKITTICNGLDVTLATISGRFYAMDRDNRDERTLLSFNAIYNGKSENNFYIPRSDDGQDLQGISLGDSRGKSNVNHLRDIIAALYRKGITDEFIKPTIINDFSGIEESDDILFFNFRSDRMRQLTQHFIDKRTGDKFEKGLFNGEIVCMSDYFMNDINSTDNANNIDNVENTDNAKIDNEQQEGNKRNGKQYKPSILFTGEIITDSLGLLISKAGIRQLRIAETEKYAHVTYFLNCGIEKPFKNEDRKMIPSPKVKTYNLHPQMSAFEICEELLKAITNDDYGLIVVNFANCDMVGHTGDFIATVQAVECLDKILGEIIKNTEGSNWQTLLTSDHGNAEEMIDNNKTKHTQHTLNPVYCIGIGTAFKGCKFKNGSLSDIAPTILQLLNIEKSKNMSGESLIED